MKGSWSRIRPSVVEHRSDRSKKEQEDIAVKHRSFSIQSIPGISLGHIQPKGNGIAQFLHLISFSSRTLENSIIMERMKPGMSSCSTSWIRFMIEQKLTITAS